jgi:ribA/ribD-fused uncharacterized protein
MTSQRITEDAVYFLGGVFSQWSATLFTGRLTPDMPEMEFNCAEQYMMARKAHLFGDVDTLKRILTIQPPEGNTAYFEGGKRGKFQDVPRAQKAAGRDVMPFDQAKWEAECLPAVLTGNYYKFSQNASALATLMNTEHRLLVEGASYDRIWGVGLDWSDPKIENKANWRGQNLLGETLMTLRSIFVEISKTPLTPRKTFDPFTMTFV